MDEVEARAKAVEYAVSLTMPLRASSSITVGTFLDIADAIAKFISYNTKENHDVSQT